MQDTYNSKSLHSINSRKIQADKGSITELRAKKQLLVLATLHELTLEALGFPQNTPTQRYNTGLDFSVLLGDNDTLPLNPEQWGTGTHEKQWL